MRYIAKKEFYEPEGFKWNEGHFIDTSAHSYSNKLLEYLVEEGFIESIQPIPEEVGEIEELHNYGGPYDKNRVVDKINELVKAWNLHIKKEDK